MQKLNETMLNVIRYLHNGGIAAHWLAGSESGSFTLNAGAIDLTGTYLVGEWIAIVGSRLNDGIYEVVGGSVELGNGSDDEMPVSNETFDGAVYRLKFPSGFVQTCKRIMDYMNSPQGDPANADVVSHSVVGFYSETRATGADGLPIGWEKKFASGLSGLKWPVHAISP